MSECFLLRLIMYINITQHHQVYNFSDGLHFLLTFMAFVPALLRLCGHSIWNTCTTLDIAFNFIMCTDIKVKFFFVYFNPSACTAQPTMGTRLQWPSNASK